MMLFYWGGGALYYSNCITFASESVFQALNIITILNILEHAYRNFSIQFIRGEGGRGRNSNIYNCFARLILFKYATSGTVIISKIS
jgi:hypothetical protein